MCAGGWGYRILKIFLLPSDTGKIRQGDKARREGREAGEKAGRVFLSALMIRCANKLTPKKLIELVIVQHERYSSVLQVLFLLHFMWLALIALRVVGWQILYEKTQLLIPSYGLIRERVTRQGAGRCPPRRLPSWGNKRLIIASLFYCFGLVGCWLYIGHNVCTYSSHVTL